jgi:hypothetical protein
MVRIDWVNHCHKNTVILLDLNVIDIKIEDIVKGHTRVLCLISLTCVLVSGFILDIYLFNQSGEGP